MSGKQLLMNEPETTGNLLRLQSLGVHTWGAHYIETKQNAHGIVLAMDHCLAISTHSECNINHG